MGKGLLFVLKDIVVVNTVIVVIRNFIVGSDVKRTMVPVIL